MDTQPNLWHQSNQQPIWQTSGNISGSELSTVQTTAERIKWLLDVQSQDEINNFSNCFNSLIKQLEEEVKTLHRELDYSYDDESDYIRRINKSDEFIAKAFDLLLQDKTSIGIIYKQILWLISGLPNADVVKKYLFETYFYELIIEYLRPWPSNKIWEWYNDWYDLPINYESSKEINQFDVVLDYDIFSWANHNTFFSFKWSEKEILNSDIINFHNARFDIVNDKISLEPLFELCSNVKWFILSRCALSNVSDEFMLKFFKNLNNIKLIWLNSNLLHKLSSTSLEIIFSNISQVKFINFNYVHIWLMDNDSLRIIFSNLRNTKHVSLDCVKLGLLSNEALDIIFSNLQNAKYLSLVDNGFSEKQMSYIKEKYWRNYFYR